MGQKRVWPSLGGRSFFGIIESRFLAVESEIKLTISEGRKWPPQLKHSSTATCCLSMVATSF